MKSYAKNVFDGGNSVISLVSTDRIRTADPFRSLFPVREDVLNRIIADMKQNGFDGAHPIIVWGGHKQTVIDGHIRLIAAAKLGFRKIPVVLRNFSNEAEALEYAIDAQRNRRNLTDAEMMKCISALDKRNKTGRPKNKNVILGRSASATAQLLGTSRGKIEKLRAINEYAIKDIKDAVRSGNLTINKAYVITMDRVRTEKYKNKKELKAARLTALENDITKIVRTRIELELKRHPDFRLTEKEVAKLLKEISAKFKVELDKLAQ
jgi:ParB family chromosome partitioning protein